MVAWASRSPPYSLRCGQQKDILQSNFAMRTETNQIEMIIIRFSVNQYKIRLDVAVSVICPFP